MKIVTLHWILITASTFISCVHDIEEPVVPLTINIQYSVDDHIAVKDSMMFVNPAGYKFSITRLEYYISNVEIKDAEGKTYKLNEVYYINIDPNKSNVITFAGITPGTYSSIRFNIGIDSINNKTAALPNTIENNNMAWPDPMGGGYHFLKLEGRYQVNGEVKGYTMHLGKNENLIEVSLDDAFWMYYSQCHIDIEMNINEWLRSPNIIDFEVDGNYSMSDDILMNRISENGKTVFKIKE